MSKNAPKTNLNRKLEIFVRENAINLIQESTLKNALIIVIVKTMVNFKIACKDVKVKIY